LIFSFITNLFPISYLFDIIEFPFDLLFRSDFQKIEHVVLESFGLMVSLT